MDDIGVIARIVLSQPRVLLTFAICLVLLLPPALVHARGRGWSAARTWAAVLAALGAALVPATTLARGDLHPGWQSCIATPAIFSSDPEAVLNLLLFAPATFFAVLAVRRALPVLVVAASCSALIEVVQSVSGLGTCQVADVLRNTLGAVAAGLAAAALVTAARRGAALRR